MTTYRDLKSHQTTIRFSPSQWEALENAARDRDMSVAQYVRDAARARLEEDAALASSERHRAFAEGVEHAREHSLGEAESAVALWEQGRQARERAKDLREQSLRQRSAASKQSARSVGEPKSAAAVWERGAAARERAQLLHERARSFRAPKRD
ncbi:MAG TPA: ribbon-helix-helix domain-containing protein [Thermoleophilaceae bacterium]